MSSSGDRKIFLVCKNAVMWPVVGKTNVQQKLVVVVVILM